MAQCSRTFAVILEDQSSDPPLIPAGLLTPLTQVQNLCLALQTHTLTHIHSLQRHPLLSPVLPSCRGYLMGQKCSNTIPTRHFLVRMVQEVQEAAVRAALRESGRFVCFPENWERLWWPGVSLPTVGSQASCRSENSSTQLLEASRGTDIRGENP